MDFSGAMVMSFKGSSEITINKPTHEIFLKINLDNREEFRRK